MWELIFFSILGYLLFIYLFNSCMIFLKEILIKLNYYIFKLRQKFVTHINIAFEKTYKKQLKSPNW